MTNEKRNEKLLKLTKRLIDKSNNGVPIIVEGTNDLKSLRSLGAKGNIFCIKNCKVGFYDFMNKFRKRKELIVMTDFDKEGIELSKSIIHESSFMKVKANHLLRKQMEGLLKTELKGIEDLSSYIEKMSRKDLESIY